MPLYMEDLAQGMIFGSATHTMDAAEIIAFAEKFDPQPFHTDARAAQSSFFGGLAASGWHTAAITMKLLVGSMPVAGGIIGGAGEITWPKPTRPGDVLQVTSEVLEVSPSRSKPGRGMATIRSETRNQHGDIVQVFTSKVIVTARPK